MDGRFHQMLAAASVRAMAIGAAAVLALALVLGLIGPIGLAQADPGAPAAQRLTGCIARQRPGDDPARLITRSVGFDCQKPAHAWGPGNYWVRFALPPDPRTGSAHHDSPPRQLRFVPQWQNGVTIITRDVTGRLTTLHYSDQSLSGVIGLGGTLSIPLEQDGQAIDTVLIGFSGALNASGLLGDPQLVDGPDAHHAELVAVAVFAAFGGLGVGLFCYNLVLWLTIRERFQLTYCLSLLAMLAYVWSNSALLTQQFPEVPHTARLATSYVMLGFVGALALQFITDFIEADKLPPRLRLFARHFGLICVLAGLGVAFAPDHWRYALDRAYAFSFVPLPVLVIALTTIAWRRGSRSIRVLAIAWAIPLLMSVLRIFHALNLVQYGLFVQYSLIIGMSVEALLSSLAMSFRITLITEERDRARADERVARQLANIDSLTGLLNRRALMEQLIAWRSPEPLRLLLVDIDRFKGVNDQYGHLIGDEVLRGVAEVLAIRADLNATVARIGGEEFALVGAAADLSEAVALGILADVRSRPMVGDVRVTVSVGMAEGLVRSEDEWRELYRRADAALYQAKSEGRNRAIHAPSSLLAREHIVAA